MSIVWPLALMCVAAFTHMAHSQCPDNLLVNGDLTGTESVNVAAPGWSIAYGTPDLNDEVGPLNSTPSYFWVGVPTASPTGGTWQNLAPSEAISQVVPTVIGFTYSICFDHCAQSIHSNGTQLSYNQAVGVAIHAGNALVVASSLYDDHYVWHQTCGSFVAVEEQTLIKVTGIGNMYSYGAVDGLCMQTDSHLGAALLVTSQPRLAPNPTDGFTRLSGPSSVTRATSTSASGQVSSLHVAGNTLLMENLEPGIYMVQCWFADGSAPLTQRVVVE